MVLKYPNTPMIHSPYKISVPIVCVFNYAEQFIQGFKKNGLRKIFLGHLVVE